MRFLVPVAGAAFVAVPAILLLYFLKARGPEVGVASFLLWPQHLADRQATTPWKRLRLSRLLLLQLLLAAALALALMRPGLADASRPASTTVVLLDGSPSMLATDVEPSRFEAALAQVGGMVERLGGEDQMAIAVLGEHAQLLAPATGDRGTLSAALDEASAGAGAADLEEGISLANAILSGRPNGSVVLLSDGHARQPAAPPPLAAPLSYRSLGTSAENVALEAIGRASTGGVFFRVANLGTAPRDLNVEMRADGRLVDVLPVRVEPGSSAQSTWSRLPAGASVLEARLSPGDHFALDDRAWLVTEAPATRRALVVTEGNGFLTRALELNSLEVTETAPGDYEPAPYDLYVFDGFVPPGPLPQPALVVAPPEGTGPVPVGAYVDAGALLPADPREPLLQYVSLRDVHVQQAAPATVPGGWRAVIAADGGPLLMVSEGQARLAQMNFDVHRSDLPLRPAFPILVRNLVDHLLPGSFQGEVRPLGQPLALAGRPGVEAVTVTAPDGATTRLGAPLPASFDETGRPGVYTVEQHGPAGSDIRRVVYQLQDPSQSDIDPGDEPLVRTVARSAAEAPAVPLEVWPWLAGLALMVLLAEWVVFLRG